MIDELIKISRLVIRCMVIIVLIFIIIIQSMSIYTKKKEINLMKLYTTHFLLSRDHINMFLHELADNDEYFVRFVKQFINLEAYVIDTHPSYRMYPYQSLALMEYGSSFNDSMISMLEDSLKILEEEIHKEMEINQ